MLKKLWKYTGIWANPHRYLYYNSLYRERKWRAYVDEIRLLAREMECPDVELYCKDILEKMNEMVE